MVSLRVGKPTRPKVRRNCRVAVATERPSLALTAFKKQSFTVDATLVEAEIHLLISDETVDDDIVKVLHDAGLQRTDLRPIEPSLEDVFVTLTRELAKP